MHTRHTNDSTFDWEPTMRSRQLNRWRDSETFDTDSSRPIWEAILAIPGVREWRILRDVAFLLTTLPIGLAAFIVLLVGGVTGLSLSWMLIGIPILIWTVGLTLRFTTHERTRLHMLLDVNVGEPRYPANEGENAFKHFFTVAKSPAVRKDLAYMMLMFPLGILEFAIALLPVSLIVSPLMELAFGGLLDSTVLGIAIDGRFEALVALVFGLVLVFPSLMLMNLTTKAHTAVARKMLG